MIKVRLDSYWKTKTGTSYVFQTWVPLSVIDYTEENQELCSEFRLDIPDSFSEEHKVYIIGDYSECGFLVCEDVSDIFDLIELESLADFNKQNMENLQEEYDKWLIEYEGDKENEL